MPQSVAGQITVYFHADYKLRAVLTCLFCISLGQFCSHPDVWVLRECKIVALCGLCVKLKEVKSFTWWFKLIFRLEGLRCMFLPNLQPREGFRLPYLHAVGNTQLS